MIILTGGAGFIGSVILQMLNERGESDIHVVDRLSTSAKWKNLIGKRFRQYSPREQFFSLVASHGLPTNARAIIHMGACSSTTETDGDYLMEVNTRYSTLLATAATERGIPFIYASSAATYGSGAHGYLDDEAALGSLRPLNRYGLSKHIFDLWLQDTGRLNSVVGLKFFNVYGPNEYHKGSMSSVIYKAFGQLERAGSISLFRSYHKDYADGESKRDFLYAADVAALVSWLLDNPKVAGVFNVGSGVARTWNDLAASVCRAAGRAPAITYIDMPSELQGQYQYFTEAPMGKLRSAGYTRPFMPLEDGIQDYIGRFLLGTERHL